MREYIDNGAKLGWLLDSDTRTAYLYRAGRTVERLVSPEQLVGESPVAGFVLDLKEIWDPDW
jgi:Uma2 family endonuclease